MSEVFRRQYPKYEKFYLYVLVALLMTSSLAAEPKLPNHIIPLYGNASLGYYYANIYVGFPPQEQSVIVDTGSGQLALPCSKCQSCGNQHIHPPFKLSQSKTSKTLTCISQEDACRSTCGSRRDSDPCLFSISYAEGSSLSGVIIEDQIQFEGDSQGESIKTTFGCTTRETNLFYTQAANGIFGLAPNRQSKLFQKLHAKHSPATGEELLFSMCIAKNGGQLIVGKLRPQIHSSPDSVKTAYSKRQNLYSLEEVGEIRLGGRVIKTKNQATGTFGVFIDSGSTFTYLPYRNYKTLLVALENACALHPDLCLIAKNRNNCFKIQKQANSTIQQTILKIFPPFEVQINKQVVLWSPADYFILKSLISKQICLGIESLDRFLLGGNWMVGRDIVFNLKQSTVEIFSNSRCQIQKQSKPSVLQQLANVQPQKTQVQVQPKLKKSESAAPQEQMPVYTGGTSSQQVSYITASFRDDSTVTETLIILISIVGLVIIGLVLCSKFLGKKKGVSKLKEQQCEVVTITQHNMALKLENQNNENEGQKENRHRAIPFDDIPDQKENQQ